MPASFTASMVAFGDKILQASEDGDVFVVQAGPTHKVIATNRLGEPVFASPALSNGVIYIRGENTCMHREMMAAGVAARLNRQEERLASLKPEGRVWNDVVQSITSEWPGRRRIRELGADSQAVLNGEELGDRHMRRNRSPAGDGAFEHRRLVKNALQFVEPFLRATRTRYAGIPS